MKTIPAGWGTRLHDQADFDASMGELGGCEGYHAESLRGRVCSLQLKLRKASAHFRRAAEIHRQAPRLTDPIQVGLTAAYVREHALVVGAKLPRQVPAIMLECGQKLRAIESLHRSLDALECLHGGIAEDAKLTFTTLLEEHGDAGPERRALWNLGLGVASLQLDERKAAERCLDNAGLHVCDPDCRTLGRAQISAWLAHVHQFAGADRSSREWWCFLEATQCPEATMVAMKRRAALLADRSLQLGRCVLI